MRAIDPLIVWALALLCGPLLVLAPLPTLATLGIGVLFWLRQLSLSALLLALLLFAGSSLLGKQRIENYRTAHTSLRQRLSAPERCFIDARIVASPSVRSETVSFIADVSEGTCERHALPAGTRVRLYGGPRSLGRGDRVEAVVQVGIVRLFRNFELPDPYPRRARGGVLASGSVLSLDHVERAVGPRRWIDDARQHVRERIERTFAPVVIGMAKALVLGENDLTDLEDEAFKSSGLAHLLAVSGTHLVFAVLSLVYGLRFVLLRLTLLAERTDVGRYSAALGAVLAVAYADFAGGSGSAWRAAWMLAAALGVKALAREVRVARAVVASIVVGWVSDPLVVLDLSFMLSLAATYGLLTLGRKWERSTRDWSRLPRFCALGFGATVASMLPCAPLLAMLNDSVTLLGIVANVLAAPFGETVALPLCLAHGLLAAFPALEQGTAWVASGALLVVRRLALATASTSGFGLAMPAPTVWHWALLVLAFTLVRRVQHHAVEFGRRASVLVTLGVAAASLVSLEWSVRRASHVEGYLRVTALDVGQGDALLVDLPDGSLMLIDGGGFVGSPVDPGRRVLLPVLRARRRERLDVVVLSHPHPDHFGGLGAVLSEVEVGQLWDTGQGLSEGAGPDYAELLRLARERDVSVTSPATLCGSFHFGGARFDVLAPCPGFTPGRDANDNSFVFRVNHGRRAALFTGDAERLQEAELVDNQPQLLKADLLKVAHHGSRTSSTNAFLRGVQAELAIVSCGMRNRFGHPHPSAMARLGAAEVLPLRIDRLGAVSWMTDGESVVVRVPAVSNH